MQFDASVKRRIVNKCGAYSRGALNRVNTVYLLACINRQQKRRLDREAKAMAILWQAR